MKLVIGIGNPGEKYKNNRHNTGFLVVDQLKTRISNFKFPISNQIKIFKSDKFMNESGDFVQKLAKRYTLSANDLFVVHDDLDIPIGSYKIQLGVGPKVHNGITSIEKSLGTKEFYRVRVGVDNRDPENREIGEDYVLQDFTEDERKVLDGIAQKICKEISLLQG